MAACQTAHGRAAERQRPGQGRRGRDPGYRTERASGRRLSKRRSRTSLLGSNRPEGSHCPSYVGYELEGGVSSRARSCLASFPGQDDPRLAATLGAAPGRAASRFLIGQVARVKWPGGTWMCSIFPQEKQGEIARAVQRGQDARGRRRAASVVSGFGSLRRADQDPSIGEGRIDPTPLLLGR